MSGIGHCLVNCAPIDCARQIADHAWDVFHFLWRVVIQRLGVSPVWVPDHSGICHLFARA